MFWGVPSADGQKEIVKVPADSTNYCNIKFPPIREDTLFSASPVLNETAGNIIDFYGSCDYNPLGEDEVLTQRTLRRHNLAGSD